MQRRMRELDHEAAKLLSEADGQRKEIEKYETHFEALRRCTKLNSVTDMLKRFADREDAKLSKMKLIQELNDQTAAVEQERRAVVAAQEEYCKVMGSADEKQRARIAELQRERDRCVKLPSVRWPLCCVPSLLLV
jgi:chromosome segregation ATPase